MKQILIAILLVATILSALPQNDLRLIEFMDGTRRWMTPEQIEKLVRPGQLVNFYDITDTRMLEINSGGFKDLAFPDKPTQQAIVRPLIDKVEAESEKQITQTITHLSTQYKTRHCNSNEGIAAALWLKEQYEKIISQLPEQRRSLFNVTLVSHSRFKQQSIIVTMKGKSDEIIVMGAHEDSISYGGDAPGADDNASGSATVLETFRIIAQSDYVPTKSLHFHAYAGEEIGLVGSRDIASDYQKKKLRVYAMLNIDMTGYNPDKANTIALITNSASSSLNEFAGKVITEYCKNKFVKKSMFGGSSDHASWTRAGYHAIFPFEYKSNPYIHSSKDTVDRLDLKNAIEYVKLSVGFVIELSSF